MMNKVKRSAHIGVVLSTLAFFLFVGSRSSGALQCPNADPWFVETLGVEVIDGVLPPGVEIQAQEDGKSVLSNHSESLFFLAKRMEPSGERPEDILPLYKLVGGRVSYYSNGEWVGFPSELEVLDFRYYADDFGWEDRTVWQDDRPANVKVPPPQRVAFVGIVRPAGSDIVDPHQYQPSEQDKLIRMELVSYYALNERYDPHAGRRNADECSGILKQ